MLEYEERNYVLEGKNNRLLNQIGQLSRELETAYGYFKLQVVVMVLFFVILLFFNKFLLTNFLMEMHMFLWNVHVLLT